MTDGAGSAVTNPMRRSILPNKFPSATCPLWFSFPQSSHHTRPIAARTFVAITLRARPHRLGVLVDHEHVELGARLGSAIQPELGNG